MKRLLIYLLVIIPVLAIGQRVHIPKENLGNHLDLKLVYQPFRLNVQNNYGHVISSKKDSLLLLKVNGGYYGHKETGVSKPVFKSYLKDCPEALKISNSGFKLYSKSKQTTFLSNTVKLVAGIGTIVYGIKYWNSRNNSDLYTGVGFGIGWGSSFLLKNYANSQYRKADKKMLNAIDTYRLNCFDPIETPLTNEDSTKHGESNRGEKMLLNYFKNDASSFILSAGLSSGISSYSRFKIGLGGNAMIAKSGFALMGDVLNSKFSTDISENEGIDWTLTASVPIFRSIKKKKIEVAAGKYLGMAFTGDFEGVSLLSSLNIDGGIQNISSYRGPSYPINGFSYKSRFNRVGLSYNAFYFLKYRLNDNRFSPKMRYNLIYLRLYAHALLNMNTEYNITKQTPSNVNPKFNKYGGVLGVDILYSRLPFGALMFKLEGGQYNYTGDSARFDVKVLLGLSFYLVP